MQIDSDGTPYVMWGDNKIQLETKPISDENVKEKASKELRETPEVVEQALAELRQLLKGTSNFLFVSFYTIAVQIFYYTVQRTNTFTTVKFDRLNILFENFLWQSALTLQITIY